MEKRLALVFLLPMLFLLGSCGIPTATQADTVIEIRFERSHGSAWGNELSLHISQQEIVYAQWVGEDGELHTAEHIPISQPQWEALTKHIKTMLPQLQKAKEPNLLQKLLQSATTKTDGSEHRQLEVFWDNSVKTWSVRYLWPTTQQAAELEELFQELVSALSR